MNTAQFNTPTYLSIDSNGNVYFVEQYDFVIRQINFKNNSVISIAGSGGTGSTDGIGSLANFNAPFSVYINKAGSRIYVADKNNNLIRQIYCTGGILRIDIFIVI